ncbi:hypothetical protein GCM10023193_51700 [Planotetraspora kaengkrachanensis]|uniref:Uncharacterized protein n=1 Tax=Planotetraspora kaengkrachanensis TaxID=575193 RepID=A0A8J3LUS6_9ACTN|nr:hypothetical protein Pka01_26350 [Planotetraspora kaengkrachanensis]
MSDREGNVVVCGCGIVGRYESCSRYGAERLEQSLVADPRRPDGSDKILGGSGSGHVDPPSAHRRVITPVRLRPARREPRFSANDLAQGHCLA